MSGAPRIPRRVLRWTTPERERDFVLGDLEEEFEDRAARDGRGRAVRWYWREAARSLWPLMTYPGRWGRWTMVGWMHDVRGALRIFRRSPGFAAVIVLTLGIGVGSATAVYSVVQGVLLTPLPFDDPDRVVMLWGESSEYPRTPLTVGDYNALVDNVGSFRATAGQWSNNVLILGEGEAEQVSLGWVTPEYFDVVGVEPAFGRAFEGLEQNAVLISHALWVRRYGSDPSVLGRLVDLSGDRFEVIGVLPPDRDPNLTTFAGAKAGHDIWRLQPADWTRGDDRSVGWLRATARLADGTSLEQAQAEVDALMTAVNETVTDRDGGTDLRVRLVPARDDLVSRVSRTLWILLGAVLGVLLIAASNVAHVLLARGEARTEELAVRTALGGSRARLVRQLVVEGGVLAAVGGLLGVGLASVAIDLLRAFAPPTLPRLDAVRLDWGVFAFALAATAAASLLFAVVPALRATRRDVSRSLGERSSTSDPTRQRLSRTLVVAEVALSLALVTSTGLLVRSMTELHAVDLGFDREGVVTFALESPTWGDDTEAAAAMLRDYERRLTAVPGVSAAGFTNRVPLAGGLFTGSYRSEDMVAADVDPAVIAIRYVTPGYLDALGVRVVEGRGLRADDGPDVIVVDETVARRAWPGGDPVGRSLEITAIGADPTYATVVGVVSPMKHAGVGEAAEETLFLPMLAAADQQNFHYMAVRVSGEPGPYVEPLRRAAREVDSDAVMARVRTVEELVDQDLAATRFATALLASFGAVALLLAAVGLHGVMAFSIRRRAREIGIRVALGAEHGEVLRGALGSGVTLVAVGIALGVALSLGSGRLLSSLLYGVRPGDVPTLLVSALVMIGVGLTGAYAPARLALSVDPAVTLREE